MWPKRMIQLVNSSEAPGIAGVRAVLQACRLEFCETEDLNEEIMEKWWEKPFDPKATSGVSGPVTDLVFCSEGTENNIWQEKGHAEGLNIQSIESLIHNILVDEVIIRVSEPTVFMKGRPLIGHILDEAGFEPTTLWPTTDGEWRCDRKQGIHWVIPESWLLGSCEASNAINAAQATEFGPCAAITKPWATTWVVRENTLDFYQAQDCSKFVGQIPRWPEPMEEQIAAKTIALCIDLGVSWLDIRLALSSIWPIKITDNLRWNFNDLGWNARPCGEELPVA
ncbi:MAG: hypothetical protein ACOYIB_00835 [Desulfosporosinus sp.]